MERSNSVATDTRLDDPRPYSVYLAHHGSVIKVGITAVARGEARLLEQGALASAIISAGSLVGARRVEILLGSTPGLPDRVSTSRKRATRTQPGSAAERSTDLYLGTAAGLMLLDTQLLAGWTLGRAPADAELAVPLEKLEPAPRRDDQEALF